MAAPYRRRRFQFSLKSLMAFVVVICLGLGGWHLLLTYGQCVEADPAVVGQPIKIRGRFFHFFAGYHSGHYDLSVESDFSVEGASIGCYEHAWADNSGWGRYKVEYEMDPVDEPFEFTMTLAPEGGSPIRGRFVVRRAE